MAHSDDRGQSWQYDGPLWPADPSVNQGPPKGQGAVLNSPSKRRNRETSHHGVEEGFTNHEVVNILPGRTAGGVIWYAVRLDYFVPLDGGFKKRPMHSFRLKIMRAENVQALAHADTATLGGTITAPGWKVDTNLATLAPGLRRYFFWNEPALYFQDGTLYLLVRGLVFDRSTGAPNIRACALEVFSTIPAGKVRDWRWRYVGELAGHAEAEELGGDGLTQPDLAKGVDGQLLALVTPDAWDTHARDFIHYGCRVVEVGSIDPPMLARDPAGKLKVRAVVTASDLAAIGPAASAYDPASATGILIGRRKKSRGRMTISLHQTGLRP